MDPRVSQLLPRLGGLYRDPTRVDRDASSLLRSSVGKNLKPAIDTLFENDGTSHQTLCLQGYIAIHYRGNTYNQLVDIYLPPGYPTRPPTCFLRLAPNMFIKEGHPHVGSDGQVYLPYLHEWRPQSHNLVEMVVAMSSTFSADPPVFARSTPPPPQPPPPDYSTAFATTTNSTATATKTPITNANINTTTSQFLDASLVQAAQQASRLETAALEAQKAQDAIRQKELAIQEEWDAKNFASVKTRVQRKLISHLTDMTNTTEALLKSDWQDKQLLQQSTERLDHQMQDLTHAERALKSALEQVDDATTEITDLIQTQKQLQNQQDANVSIDDMVVPVSNLHQQWLDLSAENHSFTDAMYFLDQALHQTTIDLHSYLKEIRSLAKKQFLVKAHVIKVTDVLRQGR